MHVKTLSLVFPFMIIFGFSLTNGETGISQLAVNFENLSLENYSEKQLRTDFVSVDWIQGIERTQIVMDPSPAHNKVLELLYPQGSVGPSEGGAQWVIRLRPADQYTISYDLKLSPDFDFRLGGKLPGLTSGGSRYTGGYKPDKGDGWSARFMWREEGKMVVYLYHIDMKGKWGDDIPLQMNPLERDRWYHVVERVTLNDPDSKNGSIEVWVNDNPVLNLENVRLRVGQQGQIDTFYFSTFFGGNTAEWGPENDSRIYFDNFRVTATSSE